MKSKFRSFLELGMGDKPIFGDTVKVYMTPSMKVQMYLESKNYDNLRHMVGGRTFADKTLYSEGKRAGGLGSRDRPVQTRPRRRCATSWKNLTPEEEQLASVLERYYNQFAAERINAVSNVLYGYDRAVTRNYAPIYTDSNYNPYGDRQVRPDGGGRGQHEGARPRRQESELQHFGL